jgi:hypothetical protein
MSVNLYNATTDTLKNVAGDIINVHSVNEMVAPVEEGITASRAYSVGEQFIIDNVLCYAMTNIAQGEEFDYDVNYYESSPLAEQVDDKQNKRDYSLTTTSKNVVGAINEVNSNATKKWSGTDSGNTYVTVDKLAYDPTNKRLGLKVNGADTVIPFKKEIVIPKFEIIVTSSGTNNIRQKPTLVIDVTNYSLLSIAQYTGVDYGWGYIYLDGVQKASYMSSVENISIDLTNASELKIDLQYNLSYKVTFGFTNIVIS